MPVGWIMTRMVTGYDLTGEWMNVSIFRNDKGIFTDVTASAGLDETSGWWNCIRAADID